MSGEIQDFDIATPEKILDKVHDSLYNYEQFPRNSQFPTMRKGELEELKHGDFITSKQKMMEARENYKKFFNDNPDAVLKNMVFGMLNRYESYLLERKHINHHFEQFGLL